MRRSSFGDAGWADHAVPDVQGHLRVHPTSLFMVFADTGKPTDTIFLQISVWFPGLG